MCLTGQTIKMPVFSSRIQFLFQIFQLQQLPPIGNQKIQRIKSKKKKVFRVEWNKQNIKENRKKPILDAIYSICCHTIRERDKSDGIIWKYFCCHKKF